MRELNFSQLYEQHFDFVICDFFILLPLLIRKYLRYDSSLSTDLGVYNSTRNIKFQLFFMFQQYLQKTPQMTAETTFPHPVFYFITEGLTKFPCFTSMLQLTYIIPLRHPVIYHTPQLSTLHALLIICTLVLLHLPCFIYYLYQIPYYTPYLLIYGFFTQFLYFILFLIAHTHPSLLFFQLPSLESHNEHAK